MAYGRINKGEVKETREQVKKHVSQMTKDEVNFLVNRLRDLDISKLQISYHLQQKFIDKDENLLVNSLLREDLADLVVEYNETEQKYGTDRRVLIRLPEEILVDLGYFSRYCNLCIVYSFVKNKVITAYYNKVGDNHSTIDMSRYDKNLKIIY